MKNIWFIILLSIFCSGCIQKQTFPKPTPSPIVRENLLEIPIPTEQPPRIHILFAGDMMFDRSIRQKIESKGTGFILEPMHSFLGSYDLVIANLEGPITTSPSLSVDSIVGSRQNYLFTFDPTIASLLAAENIRMVNIGNNHISNFGSDGISQTKSILEQAQVGYFGNTGTRDEKRMVITQLKGIRLALINYNQFVPDGVESAFTDLDEATRSSDLQIIYTHWGSEYVSTASASLQKLARAFVDRGADLIIGSHPHVIQQEENYLDKKIYYSLGNFIFDQYLQPETQKGMIVDVKIDTKTHGIQSTPLFVRLKLNSQTELLPPIKNE